VPQIAVIGEVEEFDADAESRLAELRFRLRDCIPEPGGELLLGINMRAIAQISGGLNPAPTCPT
jgi:hypothetical protein